MTTASSSVATERVLRRANSNTIQDKFLVGYQGWFTCPDDGEPVGPGHHGWLHWFDKPIPDGGRPNLDLWPDVSSYSPSELYEAPGLKMKSGEPAMLFSSRNAQTVQRHFHWMAEHGVDGAFLQRFAGQCDVEGGHHGIRRIRDEVGDRVREAAEKEGRVFAIMYDVTGVPAERVQRILEQDWLHLLHHKRILDSPNYLKEKGTPVIALWGFGFENAGHTPALVRSIAQFFRNATPGGVYLMAGTPTHWRTGEGDADRNPEFIDVWLHEFDAISPWTIGRFKTEDEADGFAEAKMKADADLIQRRNSEGRWKRIDYIPVVFPGGSGYNLSEGKWAFNDIPRKGGRFLWRQIFNARRAGARIIYGAMWDEYDEGTAFLPAVSNKRMLPVSDKFNFLSLDADGNSDLPSDWYMRICGFAAEGLRSERRIFDSFPSKELQDYWGTRPKYEIVPVRPAGSSGHNVASSSSAGPSGASSSAKSSAGGDGGQSYEDWLAGQQSNQTEEAPPPPYSLEAEEPAAPVTQATPATVPPSTSAAPASTGAVAPTLAASVSGASQPQGSSGPTATSPPPVNQQTHPQSYGPQPTNTLPHASNANAITGIANSLNAMSLGGSYPPQQSQAGPGPSSDHQSGRITSSPPPLHPAHPTASSYGQSSYGRPPNRPQTAQSNSSSYQSGPAPHPGPPSSHGTIPAAPAAPSGQWPPPEWGTSSSSAAQTPVTTQYTHPGGANLSRPQTFSANSYASTNSTPTTSGPPSVATTPSHYTPSGGASLSRPQTFSANSYGPPSSTPTTTRPPNSVNATASLQYNHHSGGANLSRPQTFSANSYHGSATPPRPSTGQGNLNPPPSQPNSSHPHSPAAPSGSSAPTTPGGAANYGGPSPAPSMPPYGGLSGPSGFPGPNMPFTSNYQMPNSQSPPPNPNTSSYTTAPNFPGHHRPPQHAGSLHFPSGPNPSSSSPYPLYGNSSSGGAPSFPSTSSAYPPGVGGGGPSPQISPPISPSGMMGSFPQPAQGASTGMGVGGPSQQFDQQPAFPQSYGNNNNAPVSSYHVGGGPQFPHVQPAAGGEMNYFGNNTMPGSSSSHVGYPGPSPGMSMPGGPASSSSSYSQPQPWTPGVGGPPGAPPSLPPRPSNYANPPAPTGGLSFGPTSSTSGAGASALGLAWSAVDKVAGKKTRQTLESQVGSLAQTGSKLFNKFTK